jgi:hypothetical protein
MRVIMVKQIDVLSNEVIMSLLEPLIITKQYTKCIVCNRIKLSCIPNISTCPVVTTGGPGRDLSEIQSSIELLDYNIDSCMPYLDFFLSKYHFRSMKKFQ